MDMDMSDNLLSAMRSFSQHQSRVIFLFTGQYAFSDMDKLNIGKYFAHVVPIKLGYLKEEACRKLITDPYQEYTLKISEEVVQTIIQETNGHPLHLQRICHSLVSYANETGTTHITQKILQPILEEIISDREEPALDRLWNEFISAFDHLPNMKDTIYEVIQKGTAGDEGSKGILLDHGYIQAIDNGKFKMCSPIFEKWILRNGKTMR
jgi:hypothetical protein